MLDNSENVNAFKGAGIEAAVMISDRGAKVLLTGYCGPNAIKTLNAAGVKVANDVTGTVGDAVKQTKGWQRWPTLFSLVVPGAGIEPAWMQDPLDFESSASTSFTTPAIAAFISNLPQVVNRVRYSALEFKVI